MFNKQSQNPAQRVEAKSKVALGTLLKAVDDLEAVNKEALTAKIENEKIIKSKQEENEVISSTIEKNFNFVTIFRNLFNKPIQEENAN